MLLFSKEKEFVFKITNAVLLVWFIAAIVFSFSAAINLLVEKNSPNAQVNCMKANCAAEQKAEDCGCNNVGYYEEDNRYEKISFYTSIANVVVVGSALYFLNKEKDTKKKK